MFSIETTFDLIRDIFSVNIDLRIMIHVPINLQIEICLFELILKTILLLTKRNLPQPSHDKSKCDECDKNKKNKKQIFFQFVKRQLIDVIINIDHQTPPSYQPKSGLFTFFTNFQCANFLRKLLNACVLTAFLQIRKSIAN